MGAHQRVPDAVTKAWHGNALEIWAKFPVCWTDNDASVFHAYYVLGCNIKVIMHLILIGYYDSCSSSNIDRSLAGIPPVDLHWFFWNIH